VEYYDGADFVLYFLWVFIVMFWSCQREMSPPKM